MKIKISTPQAIVFEDEIKQITIPTESGSLLINKIKPLVKTIIP